jgi:hypothetical protein
VDDTGKVTEKRQDNINPKVFTDSHLEEDAERRQDDGANDFDKFHVPSPFSVVVNRDVEQAI